MLLISWIRWDRPGCKISEITENHVLCMIKNYGDIEPLNVPFITSIARSKYNIGQYYELFSGWLDDPDCLVVKYEDMLTDDGASIQKIADLTGGNADGVYETAPVTQTSTSTGRPSDWRDHWTPAIDEAWRSCGGHEIEKRLGYSN